MSDASDFLDKMIGHFEEHVANSDAFVNEFGAVVTSQTIRKCGHNSSRNEHHHSIGVVVQVRMLYFYALSICMCFSVHALYVFICFSAKHIFSFTYV